MNLAGKCIVALILINFICVFDAKELKKTRARRDDGSLFSGLAKLFSGGGTSTPAAGSSGTTFNVGAIVGQFVNNGQDPNGPITVQNGELDFNNRNGNTDNYTSIDSKTHEICSGVKQESVFGVTSSSPSCINLSFLSALAPANNSQGGGIFNFFGRKRRSDAKNVSPLRDGKR